MTIALDRRLLLQVGTFGLAALALPGVAQAMTASGFTHGVASGEPSGSSVLLWTRYVGSGETRLHCEVARDEAFTRVVGGGAVIASPQHDNCAKVMVGGLAPDAWYYYRFVAPDGSRSEVGRTRTLPTGDVSRFGIGLFSCANMPWGWFNAYGHAAGRDDIDLMVHVGDYFYEYRVGEYPEHPLAQRSPEPLNEAVTLADYRLRYASYRLDPDLRRLHARFPMIAQWDDHEFANDSWQGGAANHQSETEGLWSVRKVAAERAYREWMPVSDAVYDSFQIGSLATIFRPETRITARMQQLDLAQVIRDHGGVSGDLAKALVEFRDGPWSDPARTLMGARQEDWLYKGFVDSVKRGTRWQVLAQQVVMGSVKAPTELAKLGAVAGDPMIAKRLAVIAAATQAGLPYNLDSWDGYPAARERLLRAAREADANLVVLSGDSHNAWGQNLSIDGRAVGVEFAGHSVTSPGFETYLSGVAPDNLSAMLRATNPGLVFNDTSRRGYVSLDLTPEAVTGRFHFMPTIAARTLAGVDTKSLLVKRNTRAFGAA
ncbi:alkaline phosphatase D family protein [Novosphingobium sp.]|jgi:alkaline phosphatase D|uniref:alkaline phosphatase D family protein n=1 Tax=Novosphingobium sp. TaxID=1874826 RepID=UPI002FE22670